MSEKLGPINFGTENDEVFIGRDYNHMRNYSESVAASIDAEIEEIVLNAYKRTESILREHIDQLHKVAKELVKREKITGEEFETLMQGGELPEIEEEKPEQQEKLKEIIDNAVSETDGEEAPKPEIADGADTPTLPEEKQDSDN